MRNSIYLLFLLFTAGLISCKKNKNQQNIIQYDDSQIRAYISSKGYSNMKRDTVGGDTSGIYYEILSQGTGAPVDYSSILSYVYTVQSVDGSYALTDTIANHSYYTLGDIAPAGLQLALANLVSRMGTRLRVIIPSRLAYGTAGGVALANKRVNGNQSLDYYINVVNNLSQLNGVTYSNTVDNYDDISIQKYMAAKGIAGGFTKITSGTYAGMYYKIRTAGTGPVNINSSSIVTFDYRAQLLNGLVAIPSTYNEATGITATSDTYYLSNSSGHLTGIEQALMLGKSAGAQLTVILPSRLAYGLPTVTGTIPAQSCIFFDITIDSVTN